MAMCPTPDVRGPAVHQSLVPEMGGASYRIVDWDTHKCLTNTGLAAWWSNCANWGGDPGTSDSQSWTVKGGGEQLWPTTPSGGATGVCLTAQPYAGASVTMQTCSTPTAIDRWNQVAW